MRPTNGSGDCEDRNDVANIPGDGASEGGSLGSRGHLRTGRRKRLKAYRQYVEAYQFDDYSFEVVTEFWDRKPDAPGAVEDPKQPGHWLSQRISFPNGGCSIFPLIVS